MKFAIVILLIDVAEISDDIQANANNNIESILSMLMLIQN